METLLLQSNVRWDGEQYVAEISGIDVEGLGTSLEEAQERLLQSFRSWIETRETTSQLVKSLEDAGYPGVTETTELQLEFASATIVRTSL